jgi:4-amino-4-deoxy-L-arabinose transferase-like glycosyltransferase
VTASQPVNLRLSEPSPRLLWWLIGLPAVMHLAVAGSVGLGTDEAHYALYGLQLDWSYFDHPPLVGWLNALVLLVSSSELALRLLPISLTVVTALLLHRFARRLFPDASGWVALVAVGLYESAAGLQVVGLGMVPETPLLALGMAAMLALLSALEHGRLRDWLLLGLWLGLAGLSKYTAVTLVLTVSMALLSRGQLGLLRRPGPWLGAALAAVLVLPVFWWNAQNEWISFLYQLGHGTEGQGWELRRVAKSQAAQLGLYGPGLFVFALVSLVSGWRERRDQGVALSLQLCWPVLLLFAAGAGFDPGLPHWTALAFVGAAPLAARWIVRAWTGVSQSGAAHVGAAEAAVRRPWVRRFGWFSGLLSVLLVLIVHSELLFPWVPFPQDRNIHAKFTGWNLAASEALRLHAEMARSPGSPPSLFIDNWTRASRLAWYARPEPVQVLDRHVDQFDLWYGNPSPGDRGVLVIWDAEGEGGESKDLRLFGRTELLHQLTVEVGGRRAARFFFYACEDYLGGPQGSNGKG